MLRFRRREAASLRLLPRPSHITLSGATSLCRTCTLSLCLRGLFLFLLLRIAWPYRADIHGYLANSSTDPSRFFKTWQRGETAWVLRSRKWPHRFTIAGGLTKQSVRTQPIPALKYSPSRPAEYGCQKSHENALVYIGVFSTASRWSRRVLLRTYEKPISEMVAGAKVEFKFILGTPSDQAELKALRKEMGKHGDIVLLDEVENMNTGKTHAFYRYLAKRPEPMPQFAFKADDDVRASV